MSGPRQHAIALVLSRGDDPAGELAALCTWASGQHLTVLPRRPPGRPRSAPPRERVLAERAALLAAGQPAGVRPLAAQLGCSREAVRLALKAPPAE